MDGQSLGPDWAQETSSRFVYQQKQTLQLLARQEKQAKLKLVNGPNTRIILTQSYYKKEFSHINNNSNRKSPRIHQDLQMCN